MSIAMHSLCHTLDVICISLFILHFEPCDRGLLDVVVPLDLLCCLGSCFCSPPSLIMKLIITNGEHLLIDSYDFTSSMLNWNKYIKSNISLIIINAKISNVLLVEKY